MGDLMGQNGGVHGCAGGVPWGGGSHVGGGGFLHLPQPLGGANGGGRGQQHDGIAQGQ